MYRPFFVFATFLWVQAQVVPASGIEGALERYGMPGIALGLIVLLWREDRKARITAQAAADERYSNLVQSMLRISTQMAEAVQALTDALAGKVAQCPWGTEEHQGLLSKLQRQERGDSKIS